MALEDRKILDLDVADASEATDKTTKQYNEYFDHLFGDIQKQIEERMQTIKLEHIKDGYDVRKTK